MQRWPSAPNPRGPRTPAQVPRPSRAPTSPAPGGLHWVQIRTQPSRRLHRPCACDQPEPSICTRWLRRSLAGSGLHPGCTCDLSDTLGLAKCPRIPPSPGQIASWCRRCTNGALLARCTSPIESDVLHVHLDSTRLISCTPRANPGAPGDRHAPGLPALHARCKPRASGGPGGPAAVPRRDRRPACSETAPAARPVQTASVESARPPHPTRRGPDPPRRRAADTSQPPRATPYVVVSSVDTTSGSGATHRSPDALSTVR